MSNKSLPDQEDRDLAQLQATWQSRLDAAGPALDQFEPPAHLFGKIEARIQSEEKQRATRTIRADFGVWEEIEPGVQKKLLYVEANSGWQSYLIKMEAGASVIEHHHDIIEECFVIDGEIQIDGELVGKGDLYLAYPGFFHKEIVSRTGALLYVRGQL